ncbi:MAG: hypothetical protein ACRYF0_08350 [Janthinobacterium lividum]
MSFSDDYLRRIVDAEVVGDFPPFTLGSITKTENYIRKILARLVASPTLLIEEDFNSYGSGFASYIEVKVSKRDGSDRVTLAQSPRTIYDYDGLVLYISRLTPYWFYGGSKWSKNYENGRCTGGAFTFLTPDSLTDINQALWQHDSQLIEALLQEFRYGLLTPTELRQPAPAGLAIPTILADKPYSVFDCFFYWED